jgi:hypothetical protein
MGVMADSTDIDALVIQARATARELNELLEKLEAANVEVSVIWPQRIEGYLHDSSRVELVLRFRAERAPGNYAQTQPTQQQEQLEVLRNLKNRGIL